MKEKVNMNKNERTHGDEMSTIGELHGLYKVKIVINKMINKLEVAYETDKKGRKNKNDERRRTVKKDR
jgi:hypothetical protein